MRAITIKNPGPNSKLAISTQAMPVAGSKQVVIRVHATALNRADLLQRRGKYPPPAGETDIPGLEVSGCITEVGPKVTQFKVGDTVYGLVGSGGYADYCLLNESLTHKIPKNLNNIQSAAIPEALTTAYATLFDLGKLKKDETLLIHGAGSGIASLAIQMAKQTGAYVITTVGQEFKIKKAMEIGADQVINYNKSDFENRIEENSIDLIIDFIGGDYLDRHLHLLKPKGRLVQIATMQGTRSECNLGIIVRKRINIMGFVLRPQSLKEKARLWKLAHKHWFSKIENGDIKPIIDSTFSITDIEKAHEAMQQSKHFGKITIKLIE